MVAVPVSGFRETASSIRVWADATFGAETSNLRGAIRANEEMAELLKALSLDGSSLAAGEEIADICIVLFRLADQMGIDPLLEVERKMQINRSREWLLDGSGHGYHR